VLVSLGAVIVAGGLVALWKGVFQTASAPKVLRFTQLTNDGQAKAGPLAAEQSQVHANWSPDGNLLVFGTLFVPNAPIYTLDLRSQSVSAVAGSNGLYAP